MRVHLYVSMCKDPSISTPLFMRINVCSCDGVRMRHDIGVNDDCFVDVSC
jgi:hypothetical protein